MKSVKIPNLSSVEQNVPFVHFHKDKDDSKKYFLVEILINAPLGTHYEKPEILEIADSKTIVVTFKLDHPKHEKSDAYELIHIDQFKVLNVFESEDTLLCIDVHVNTEPGKIGPQDDGSVTVKYRDIRG